jgi:hypothetical protein
MGFAASPPLGRGPGVAAKSQTDVPIWHAAGHNVPIAGGAAPVARDAGRGRGRWAQTGPIACRLRVFAGRGGAPPVALAVQRAAYSARLPALTAALSVLDALPAAAGAFFAGLAVSAGTASALAVALRLGALATGRRLRAVPHS